MSAAADAPRGTGAYVDSLLRHDDAFARLLGLIPAKFYLPAEDDSADGAFQKVKKTKAQKKQEAEARREASRAAKRAKLDPANTKSAQEVQEERRRAQEAEHDEEDEEMGDEEVDGVEDGTADDEAGDDSISFAGTSIDALGDEDGEQAHEDGKEAPTQEPAPAARPALSRKASIAELRERLHSKIETLHKKRHPHESASAAPPNSKQALLEERRRQRGEMRDRRRHERKEARRQAKASGKPIKPAAASTGVQGSTQQAGLLVADSGARGRGKDATNEVSYGQVSFDSPTAPSSAKKSKYALPSDPKSALAALEARKRKQEARAKRLAEKHGDEHAGDALDEEERWGKAMAAAGGVRIRDNEQMLKQTLKRREKAKAKSTKAWNDRRKAEQEAQAARQKKRMDNIAARREAKLAKHGKSTGKKPTKAHSAEHASSSPSRGASSTRCHNTVHLAAARMSAATAAGERAGGEPPAQFSNPYEGSRNLTRSQQKLLGEYARLAGTVRRVAALSTQLASSATHTPLLAELRVIERKMGLVLTLFKASVWAIVMQQSDAQDDAELDELELQYEQMPMPSDGTGYGDDETAEEHAPASRMPATRASIGPAHRAT